MRWMPVIFPCTSGNMIVMNSHFNASVTCLAVSVTKFPMQIQCFLSSLRHAAADQPFSAAPPPPPPGKTRTKAELLKRKLSCRVSFMASFSPTRSNPCSRVVHLGRHRSRERELGKLGLVRRSGRLATAHLPCLKLGGLA